MQIYKIADEYQAALNSMQEMDLSEDEIKDSLESIKTDFKVKAVALAAHILNMSAELDGVNNALKNMSNRKLSLNNKLDFFKSYLVSNMIAVGEDKIKTGEIDASLRLNPPKLILDDDAEIDNYKGIKIKEEIVILKDVIKRDLQAGTQIKGAYLKQESRLHFK